MSDLFRRWLEDRGVPEAESRSRVLQTYVELICKYGRRINLVGRLDPDFVERELILGSLQLLRAVETLPSVRASRSGPHPRGCTLPKKRLVDVGSGAGLPGIPLAIVADLNAVLVEARSKRAAFLETAVRSLGLPRVSVVDYPVESLLAGDVTHPTAQPPFDWAVARAFRPPGQWLSVASKLVSSGGHVAVYASRHTWSTVSGLGPFVEVARVEDETRADRLVLVLRHSPDGRGSSADDGQGCGGEA